MIETDQLISLNQNRYLRIEKHLHALQIFNFYTYLQMFNISITLARWIYYNITIKYGNFLITTGIYYIRQRAIAKIYFLTIYNKHKNDYYVYAVAINVQFTRNQSSQIKEWKVLDAKLGLNMILQLFMLGKVLYVLFSRGFVLHDTNAECIHTVTRW